MKTKVKKVKQAIKKLNSNQLCQITGGPGGDDNPLELGSPPEK